MEGATASAEALRYAEYARTPTGAGKGQAELDRGLVSAWRDPHPRVRKAPTASSAAPAFTHLKGDVFERGGDRGCRTGVLRCPRAGLGTSAERPGRVQLQRGPRAWPPSPEGRAHPGSLSARGPGERRKAESPQSESFSRVLHGLCGNVHSGLPCKHTAAGFGYRGRVERKRKMKMWINED